MTAAKVRLAMAAMGQKETKVTDLCSELAFQLLLRGPSSRDGTLDIVTGQPMLERQGKNHIYAYLALSHRDHFRLWLLGGEREENPFKRGDF